MITSVANQTRRHYVCAETELLYTVNVGLGSRWKPERQWLMQECLRAVRALHVAKLDAVVLGMLLSQSRALSTLPRTWHRLSSH